MTRKHFKAIASIIKDNTTMCGNDEMCGNCMPYVEKELLIFNLSLVFKELNPLFNKQLFVNACNDDNV